MERGEKQRGFFCFGDDSERAYICVDVADTVFAMSLQFFLLVVVAFVLVLLLVLGERGKRSFNCYSVIYLCVYMCIHYVFIGVMHSALFSTLLLCCVSVH